MTRKSFVLMALGTVVFLLCSTASADVPHMINYQGKLTTAQGGCLNDTVQMTFTIYSDSLGTQSVWTETQDGVIVTEGVFNVLLGSVNALHDTMFNEPTRYLGVQVESDPEMRPLKPMVTVPYAFRVSTVDGASGGTIEGDVNIEGDVIITGDTVYVGSLSIEPTTRHYAIPAASFRPLYPGPSDSPASVDRTSITFTWFKGSSGNGIVVAPLQLPHGATIFEAVGFFEGGWASIELKVFRVPFVGPQPETQLLGSEMNPFVTGYDSLIISSFADSTVDNANYCYFVEFYGAGSPGSGHVTFYDARITYVIDKPLP